MSSLLRPLGSFNNWAILRLGELLFVAGGLLPLVAQRQKLSILLQASVVSLLALLPVYFHPFAFGYVDDQGMVFLSLLYAPFRPLERSCPRRATAGHRL